MTDEEEVEPAEEPPEEEQHEWWSRIEAGKGKVQKSVAEKLKDYREATSGAE